MLTARTHHLPTRTLCPYLSLNKVLSNNAITGVQLLLSSTGVLLLLSISLICRRHKQLMKQLREETTYYRQKQSPFPVAYESADNGCRLALSLTLKSKKLKTEIYSYAHSPILSLSLAL